MDKMNSNEVDIIKKEKDSGAGLIFANFMDNVKSKLTATNKIEEV
jgi:hypothetical protein